MSHFTVLTVISPERFERNKQEFLDYYQPALEAGDANVMGTETGRKSAEVVLKAKAHNEASFNHVVEGAAVQEAIGELLAPYQENNMGDCPEEYLAFHIENDDATYDWEVEDDGYGFSKKHPEAVGQMASEYLLEQWEGDKRNEFRSTLVAKGYPEDRLDEVDADALLATVAHGYHAEAAEDGTINYGYFENPEAKWDWWKLGGRWSGALNIKEDAEGINGRPGLFGQPNTDPNRADAARIRDLNLDEYEENTRAKVQEFWENYQTYIETGEEPGDGPPLYGVHFDLMQIGLEWTNRDPYVTAVEHNREIRTAKQTVNYLSMSEEQAEDLSRWQQDDRQSALDTAATFEGGKEAYIAELRQQAEVPEMEVPPRTYDKEITLDDLQTKYRWYFEWSTYAAVDDEGWHSKGEMGWWGMSSDDSDDRESWSKTFFGKFVRSRDSDTILAVVDCHI